jgi:hypothetical protein
VKREGAVNGRSGREEVGEKRWEEDREDDRKRKSEIECKEKLVCM